MLVSVNWVNHSPNSGPVLTSFPNEILSFALCCSYNSCSTCNWPPLNSLWLLRKNYDWKFLKKNQVALQIKQARKPNFKKCLFFICGPDEIFFCNLHKPLSSERNWVFLKTDHLKQTTVFFLTFWEHCERDRLSIQFESCFFLNNHKELRRGQL